jgi:hypothetical protein
MLASAFRMKAESSTMSTLTVIPEPHFGLQIAEWTAVAVAPVPDPKSINDGAFLRASVSPW